MFSSINHLPWQLVVTVLVCVGVATRVWAQDGSYMLGSRGVEVEQGLTPPQELFQNHQAFSQAFKERSDEMARLYTTDQVEYNDPVSVRLFSIDV